jgi:hypothetical protein
VSLAAGPVTKQAGQKVGRLVDVVARLYRTDPYAPVTGPAIRAGITGSAGSVTCHSTNASICS